MSDKTTLKSTATKGMFWSAVDKFAAQAGQFVISIVLARILMPEDFGLIGMLSIFIAISQSFIESGMESGLIQKRDRTDVDFSTVFVFNFVISLFFYIVLFVAAPYIAVFYDMPKLVPITRILALNIIINSLGIVQRANLTIKVDFKTHAKVNVLGVIFGGSTALLLAYYGWGVWALVAQTLFGSTVAVAALWYFSKWKPSVRFSMNSFTALFGYGSKLLVAGIYAQVLNNIYNISIGKAYAPAELGYYTRAKSLAEMSSGTVSSVLQQVTFPILASLQSDQDRMVSVYRRIIKMTAFFIFPIMTLISLLADPLIRLLLGQKWISVIVLLQLTCIARIFTPISGVNMNILNAVGRSDLFLKVDLSKLPVIIIAMIITIPMGVQAMIIGQVVTSGICFFINAYMPGKLFGYGALEQLKDMFPVLVATAVMSIIVFIAVNSVQNNLLQILIGCTVGLVTYGFTAYKLKIQGVNEVKDILIKIKGKI